MRKLWNGYRIAVMPLHNKNVVFAWKFVLSLVYFYKEKHVQRVQAAANDYVTDLLMVGKYCVELKISNWQTLSLAIST